VTLNVNGKDRVVEIEPRVTLADALRDRADLTGTKVVCDRGACSACTVFLDGVPTLSCMTLAIDAQGRKIKTIEGLADGETLHPVQAQFIEHDAMQCGYCTPGMIVASVALLRANASPSEAEIKRNLEGNICRCGTYNRIVAAVQKAAGSMTAEVKEPRHA
jgi:carbon-monoxide dehydrogenase small subunit/xanthine dehydrogenase YagT iron-sulfur-binding subunit